MSFNFNPTNTGLGVSYGNAIYDPTSGISANANLHGHVGQEVKATGFSMGAGMPLDSSTRVGVQHNTGYSTGISTTTASLSHGNTSAAFSSASHPHGVHSVGWSGSHQVGPTNVGLSTSSTTYPGVGAVTAIGASANHQIDRKTNVGLTAGHTTFPNGSAATTFGASASHQIDKNTTLSATGWANPGAGAGGVNIGVKGTF